MNPFKVGDIIKVYQYTESAALGSLIDNCPWRVLNIAGWNDLDYVQACPIIKVNGKEEDVTSHINFFHYKQCEEYRKNDYICHKITIY